MLRSVSARRILLAFVVAGVVAVVVAPSAGAHNGSVAITCSSVTFTYNPDSGFNYSPETVFESVSVDGQQVASGQIDIINDGGGTDTLQISVPPGTHTVVADAYTAQQGEVLYYDRSTGMSGPGFPVSQTITCGPPPACPSAPSGYPNLGSAAPFTVFALDGGTKQTGNFSLVTIHGNVGVAAGAAVTNQAPSSVLGNVYVDSGGSFGGPGKVTGSIFTAQNLAGDRSDAINASNTAASLSPTFTFGNVTSNTTVTGVSGLNVVDITGNINLNNGSLTLTGPSDAWFVVNVAGSITLVGTGGIHVGGSVPASQLLVNMTGVGKQINTHVGNDIQGTLLGPYAGGSLDGAFGSLLLGQNFSLLSGAQVTFEGCVS